MMALNIIRSLFPAFRGYSQALIVDELQSLIASDNFTWTRLLYLLSTEVFRRILEGCLDSFATSNENIVTGSARFFIEYKQMEQRVRLDVPTLDDPIVRSLLQESDLFVRSFSGSGFGLLSPLDFIRIFFTSHRNCVACLPHHIAYPWSVSPGDPFRVNLIHHAAGFSFLV